jgi:hypothetical protein
MKNKSRLLLFFLFCIIAQANADDSYPNWSLKGFGTLGFTGTDSKNLGFYRDLSQTQDVTQAWGISTDSSLGVQIDANISPTLHATAQWIARDHSGNFFEQNLEWAFLRWLIDDDLTLRIGRLGVDVFLLSDYRNVGYAYPWMRPPHEFYAFLGLYHFDGMDVTKKWNVGDGFLSLKSFAGYSHNQYQDRATGQNFNFDFATVGANVLYETGDWLFRASYGLAHTLSESAKPVLTAMNNPLLKTFYPQISQFTKNVAYQNTDNHFYSLGAAYDDGVWLAQTEASYIMFSHDVDIASGYLSVGRHFDKFTAYSLLGITKSFYKNINVPQPAYPVPELLQLQQIVDSTINEIGVNEKSVSLGMRWDFYSNMAFKTQWTHYWLSDNGKKLWMKPASGASSDSVNVWSVGIDFTF